MKMFSKTIIVSFVVLLLGAFVGFVAFPIGLEQVVRRRINLLPGSELRKFWEKKPVSYDFRIYVLNVSNAEEVEKGGKPVMSEMGPFVFEEWQDKYDIKDTEEEDTVSYNARSTFILNPQGASVETTITMPNILLQFIVSQAKADKMTAIAKGLDIIFKPKSAFITVPFIDLFFNGIDVNCNHDHPAAKLICERFRLGEVPGMLALNSTHFKFSLLGASNNTNAGRYKVSRGKTLSYTLGDILAYNDQPTLKVWPNKNTEQCNWLESTDGNFFAPYQPEDEPYWFFSAQLCRSIRYQLLGQTNYKGLPAHVYTWDLDNITRDSSLSCFCSNDGSMCPLEGTMELLPCTNNSLIASLPLFYKADAKLAQDVDGIFPVETKSPVIIVERRTGTVLSVANKLQFNLAVAPIHELPVLAKLRKLVIPLFYVEQILTTDEEFSAKLYKQIYLPIQINHILRWIAIGLGSLGCILGAIWLRVRGRYVKRVAHWAPRGETRY